MADPEEEEEEEQEILVLISYFFNDVKIKIKTYVADNLCADCCKKEWVEGSAGFVVVFVEYPGSGAHPL